MVSSAQSWRVKWKSASTQMVDLGGAFAMPGFNDAHAHLGSAGEIKLSVDVTGVQSLAEMQQRIAAHGRQAVGRKQLSCVESDGPCGVGARR